MKIKSRQEKQMKFTQLFTVSAAIVVMAACSPISDEAKKELKKPVNCATAKQDLATLKKEKVSAGEKAAAGIMSIAPIGLVTGVATGTQGDKMKVASGEYNEMIDKKIAEIKQTCNL